MLTPLSEQNFKSSYETYIQNLAKRKIKGFCGTIDEQGEYYSQVYAGNSSLTESIAVDYRGRFLVELIQNANDAQFDDKSDGIIEIVFDRSQGKYGVLYVANSGNEFNENNVNALCDIGLSSKPPGESIGNKGLGFRSVIHITDLPRIYSQCRSASNSERFFGYCFGFANSDYLKEQIPNSNHLKLAEKDLPKFHVPVWREEQNKTIIEFAHRGFATVIELPLRDEFACKEVEQEIGKINLQTVPMILFMNRILCLSFRVISANGDIEQEFELHRRESIILKDFDRLSKANLGDHGKYLVVSRKVPESKMKEAILDGIRQKKLHTNWNKWQGQGEVALAVRLDKVVNSPRLYTYLPLGEQAIAPFSGYLHASFFPTSNRNYIDIQIKLNAILLDEATSIAATAIAMLSTVSRVEISRQLDSVERACAVVDLLCWQDAEHLKFIPNSGEQIAKKVTESLDAQTFDEAFVVPCFCSKEKTEKFVWRSPYAARQWPDNLEIFAPQIAASIERDTGIVPIWSGIASRIDRLNRFLSKHSERYKEYPTDFERAKLVSLIAEKFAAKNSTTKAQWIRFYRELPIFLNKLSSISLANKRLLLCSDGVLRKTPRIIESRAKVKGKRKRGKFDCYVFSPPSPKTSADDNLDFKPPKKLSDRFEFLSEDLDWHGELKSVRRWLEDANLVWEFDRETILAQLSKSLNHDTSKKNLGLGLQWAFRLWRQPRAAGRTFKLQLRHRFRVPLMNGKFIDAREAIFSHSWPNSTLGPLLNRFLKLAPPNVPDLNVLESRLLAPAKHWVFQNHSIDDWVEFLTDLGVKKGLHPVDKRLSKLTFSGYQLSNFSFCQKIEIPPMSSMIWKKDVEVTEPDLTRFYYEKNYSFKSEIWWLPGQGDFENFEYKCQELYAQLIISWLLSIHINQDYWILTLSHNTFYRADTRKWPTPISTFLRVASWVPAEEYSTSNQNKIMVKPSDIWLMPDPNDRFKSFLLRPTKSIRLLLQGTTINQIDFLKIRTGVCVLNDEATLVQQLTFLASQFARPEFAHYYERHLLNLYHRTWRLFSEKVKANKVIFANTKSPNNLLVKRNYETEFLPLKSKDVKVKNEEILYVQDRDDETKVNLVEVSGKLLFKVQEGSPEQIGSLLKKLYGNRVRLISEANFSFLVDGENVETAVVEPLLKYFPSLDVMVAVAIENLTGTEKQRLPVDRSTIITKVKRLMLIRASTISFQIDSKEINHSENEQKAFFLRLDNQQPVIVVRVNDPMNWGILDDCLKAICEGIEQRSLYPHLRILVLQLKSGNKPLHSGISIESDIDQFARLLHLNQDQINDVRETLFADFERQIPWLRALLYLAGGKKAVDTISDAEDITQMDELLTPWFQQLNLSNKSVLNACRNALSAAEFRKELGLDFASFNQSLIAVGSNPETYEDKHKHRMKSFLCENEFTIIDALRVANSKFLMQYKQAPRYFEARNALRDISPDADWLLFHEEPSENLIILKIDAWLMKYGAKFKKNVHSNLEPLEEVRKSNENIIQKFATTAQPLVRAWCVKAGIATPDIWQEINKSSIKLREIFDKAGIFDFQKLDDVSLLKWIQVVGIWPQEMPLSTDMNTLNLSLEDIDIESTRAREEAEQRRRRNRSISFNGHMLDPVEVNLQKISSEISSQLSKQLLSTPLSSKANLKKIQSAKNQRSRQEGRKTSKFSGRYSPSEKTDLIGKLGEIVVYHWLRYRLPKQDINAAWRSMNACPITGREGSDSLGYDFEVSYNNQTWQLEVKSSLRDPCEFELGESEVRAARDAAKFRSGKKYKIAYVSNLSESLDTSIEILPNPMSEEGDFVLSLLGQGIRFGFNRKN